VHGGLAALAKFDAASNSYIKNVFFLNTEAVVGAERLP
jgi:hypothetical protein